MYYIWWIICTTFPYIIGSVKYICLIYRYSYIYIYILHLFHTWNIYQTYIIYYIYIYITYCRYYTCMLNIHPNLLFSPLTYTNSFPIKKISLEPPQSPQVEFRDAKSKAKPSQATSWTTAWLCYIFYTLCELGTIYIFTHMNIYIYNICFFLTQVLCIIYDELYVQHFHIL